jgi:hypothetical protein
MSWNMTRDIEAQVQLFEGADMRQTVIMTRNNMQVGDKVEEWSHNSQFYMIKRSKLVAEYKLKLIVEMAGSPKSDSLPKAENLQKGSGKVEVEINNVTYSPSIPRLYVMYRLSCGINSS